MSEVEKNNNSLDRLSQLIEQKTNENEALKKLLEELNKDQQTGSFKAINGKK